MLKASWTPSKWYRSGIKGGTRGRNEQLKCPYEKDRKHRFQKLVKLLFVCKILLKSNRRLSQIFICFGTNFWFFSNWFSATTFYWDFSIKGTMILLWLPMQVELFCSTSVYHFILWATEQKFFFYFHDYVMSLKSAEIINLFTGYWPKMPDFQHLC